MTALLERVAELASDVRRRSDEIEEGRRVPRDLVDALTAAGVFRITVPRSHGGDEFALVDVCDVITELSRADGSVGWIVNIATDGALFATGLPRQAYDKIYASGPDVLFGGSGAPKGNVAVPGRGGSKVTGRWPFASGCQHDDWLIVWAQRQGDVSESEPSPSAPPELQVFFAPSSAVGIEVVDTWNSVGLRGTGSHDLVFRDVVVSEEFSFAFPPTPWPDGPLYRMPYFGHAALRAASVGVGIAFGALDELLALALTKRPTMSVDPSIRSADHPLFQHELGEMDALLRAARNAIRSEAVELYLTASRDEPFDRAAGVRARSTAAWAVAACEQVVDTLYRLGGAQSVYMQSPLQRRLRDIHVVTQHVAVRREAHGDVGAVLTGSDPSQPLPTAPKQATGDARRDLFR